MKTFNVIGVALVFAFNALAADVLTEKLQRGLFEEEANHNLDAAIKEYQSVIAQADEQRKLTATALFRLGECYRKLGKTNEANAAYQRVLRDFSEQEQLVKLSRDLLPGSRAQTASIAMTDSAMTQAEAEELARVKALAQNSPDLLNTPHKEFLTSLQWAAQQGFPTVLEFLLAQGLDVNGPERKTPPIVLAARRGHLRIVESLLKRGADVDAGVDGFTALMAAVTQNFRGVAELLLARGADVKRVTSGGQSALNYAAASGSSNLVALLLVRGADPNVLAKPSTPQNFVAPGPRIADSEYYDTYNGATPLHHAARHGLVGMAEMLIKAGARVNATNWAGATPLHIAVAGRQTNTADLLLRHGADPNARDRSSYATPLGLADAEMTELLLSRGANVNEPAYASPTSIAYPLHLAAGGTNAGVLRALLAAKPQLEVTNSQGHTPLWSALLYHQTTNLAMLIEAGADVRRRWQDVTAIQTAVSQGSARAAELLLKAGADANETEVKTGDTLLHVASRARHASVVRTLLDAGANPDVFNQKHETPYSIAEAGAEGRSTSGSAPTDRQRTQALSQEVAHLLKQRGADVFMRRRLEIRVRRGKLEHPIFTRGTNVLNKFTLMELLGAVYQYGGLTHPANGLQWPDFARISIQRLERTNVSSFGVDLSEAVNSQACATDQWLEWGDTVTIPESVHPLSVDWDALPAAPAASLSNCVARSVQVAIGKTNFVVRLGPLIRAVGGLRFIADRFQFAYLPVMLRNEREVNRHLRPLSDLSRVTVRRTDPLTKETRTMTFDVTEVAAPGIPLEHTLWLRDGDVIKVPEKP